MSRDRKQSIERGKSTAPDAKGKMNAETEKVIDELIRKHGLNKVKRHLNNLIGESYWSDWQRVDSAVKNRANRMKRYGIHQYNTTAKWR